MLTIKQSSFVPEETFVCTYNIPFARLAIIALEENDYRKISALKCGRKLDQLETRVWSRCLITHA